MRSRARGPPGLPRERRIDLGGVTTSGARPRFEIFESIEAVDRDLWDSLLEPDDLQASHAFIEAVERSRIEDAELRHVVGFDGDRPVCHATFSKLVVGLDVLAGSGLRGTAAALRKLSPGFLRLPILFCGLPVSFGQSSLRFATDGPHEKYLGGVLDAFDDVERSMGSAVQCFKEFNDSEADRLRSLDGRGFLRAPSLTGYEIANRWASFDDYVAAMRSGYRRQLKADLFAARESGLEIEWGTIGADDSSDLHALYLEVMARAEHRLEVLPPTFLANLENALGPAVECVRIRCGGRTVAMGITLRGPATYTFLLAGLDHGYAHEHRAYGVLVTEVVRRGIETGASRIVLGQTSGQLKSRLGARESNRWIWVRGTKPLTDRLIRRSAGRLFPVTGTTRRVVFRP
jgi:hypothetical protein